MVRRAAVMALVASLLACSGGDDGESVASTSSTARRSSTSSSTSTTRAAPRIDPNTVLVADGYRFGSPPPSLEATADVYQADRLVLGSEVAIAWDAARIVPVADVVVLALDDDALVDDEVAEAYVDAFRQTVARAGQHTTSFLHENLLVVLVGADARAVDALGAAMKAAVAAGQRGSKVRSTPMRELPPASVFVELPGARFDPFPVGSDTTVEGTPTTEQPDAPPEPPPMGPPGVLSAVEGRFVVVGGEERAVAWSMAVRTRAVESAEQVETYIVEALRARSGAAPTTVVIADQRVWEAERIRAFRHGNLVVIAEGEDALTLDAVVEAWVVALRP